MKMRWGGRSRSHRRRSVYREALFITSKLWVQDANAGMAKAGIAASLKNPGWNTSIYICCIRRWAIISSAWRALEEAYEAGTLKAIGVSNFYAHVLANFCETVRIRPMVNQVELHPYFAQPAALETMMHYHVQPEARAPLGGGRHNPYEEAMRWRDLPMPTKNRCSGGPALERAARRHGHS